MSLRTKVLLPLVLFTVLLSAYLYAYWMPRFAANSEAEYRTSTERHLDTVAEGLIPLLLAHQLDTIYENLNVLLKKNDDWISVRLIDAEGRSLYPLQLPLPAQSKRNTSDVRTLGKKIRYLGKDLGALSLTVDFGPRLADMKKKYRELIAVLLLATIAFSFLAGIVLDRMIVRPVQAVSAASQRLAQGDFDVPLQKAGDDEVGQLIDRFAGMRHAIRGYQAELVGRNRLIERNQQSLAEAQRIARLGSWELDGATKTLAWSAEVYRIFGMQPRDDGVDYHAFLDQVHPDDRAQVNDAYSGCLLGDAPFDFVHRIVRKPDNAVRHVQERCEHFRDEQGNPRGSRGTIHDITDLMLAEAAVADSEKKLRSITSAAQDAILMLDQRGRISYWNPAAENIFQYSGDEVMGRELHRLLAPQRLHDAFRAGFARFQSGGEGPIINTTVEMTALRKDGTEFPAELSVSSLNLNGMWHAIGIVRDITERKKLEAQLLQSQKMEAIGQLAGGIAHDFNNILSAIMGYGQMVSKKMAADDPLKLYMGYLLESVDRAAHLTRSLLAFSRKQIIKPATEDLNEIIGRIEKFLRRIIGEDIELKTLFRQPALNVNADRSQIEQVLMNLATNARDAMPQGGVLAIETDIMHIDDAFIRAHGYGEPGRYAVMTVTDNGDGMDEAVQKKIFEPFFTTKEVGKGTGLGLSMAYGIIKQHRGFINVYSEPDKGTTFRIYLPLMKTALSSVKAQADAMQSELPTGTETVLLAEDDEAVRRLSRIALTEAGYRVIEAADGEEAVSRHQANGDAIDLLILDVIMPKMSGKETYERIRAARPDVPAIFVSGYTADKICAEGILERDAELILKPISPSHLLKKVREVLDKK